MADLPPHIEPHPDVAGSLLGTLTEEEAARFEAHLDGCDVCRRELDELGALPGLLAGLPPDTPLPAGLEARTFDAIERAAAEAPNAAARVVPMAAARARRRRASWVLSAAAALIIVVGGVAVVARPQHHAPAPLATVRLVAPDGGGAHGTAVIEATLTGLSINLDVAGLPPSPPGTLYTCWLVGRGDTPAHQNRVSVGSFVVGRSGTADLHWDSGADLKQFGTLGVTLEPENGDPLHQGPKVLEAV